MFKLVYIKDGEIHSKDYVVFERMNADWDRLCKQRYPAWALTSEDGDNWDTIGLVNLHTCWHRVPECRWPKEFLNTNDGFTGRRFDYSPQLDIYCYYKHNRTKEGFDVYFHIVLDKHGKAFSYITMG